ncbi:uncharacterized protein [Choristoneura fumiferana]|uniref:uncharacterized protein n=1 Tax=Choristoneura fumiferana TaxID=7141 RepID=UPI003D15E23F
MLHYVSIICLLGAATAAPSYVGQDIAAGSVSNPNYGFNYAVSDPQTGDNKAQTEQREGGVVKGSYSLSEPDGTIRVVDYTADPVTGFNAVVKRIGPAAHPQRIALAPAPIIEAPVSVPIVAAPVYQAPIITKAVAPIAAPIIDQSLLGYGNLGYGLKGELGLGNLGLGLKGGLELGGLGLGLKGGLELGSLGLNGIGLGLDAGLWKH